MASNPLSVTCETCEWYAPTDSTCRCHAPLPFSPHSAGQMAHHERHDTYWPQVATTDWCGDHTSYKHNSGATGQLDALVQSVVDAVEALDLGGL